jgi:hypothetical protein
MRGYKVLAEEENAVFTRTLIAVWTKLEPLPLVVSNPLPIVIGLVLFGVLHAVIYRSVAPAWKRGVRARGTRFSLLIFVVAFLFWEFFTPFNQFGEPVWLIGVELLFWATVALAEGFVISAIIERSKPFRGDRS